MGRNLLLCLDGTNNEPETGATNVVRLYDLAIKDENQLVYYDPGVGTMGARSATSAMGKALTRVTGLAVGSGIRANIEDAYLWLMRHYQQDDRIFIVGFSRGAYTSVALAGMLNTVGLLRPGADNLIPYAMDLYAASSDPDKKQSEEEKRKYWDLRDDFRAKFGNPAFPGPFKTNIRFAGLWDTVKSVGWLNAKARYEQAHWPFTHKLSNVEIARLGLAIDEKRAPYAAYRFDDERVAKYPDRYQQVWFAGVHSDVGGQYPDDHRLSDIALGWMAHEASLTGLRIDETRHKDVLGVGIGEPLPTSYAVEGRIHPNSKAWWLAGPGWRPRKVRLQAGDQLHSSVQARMDATGYRPRFEEKQ
jgi:uncharacterized protein (DUF2235 family)